MLTQDTNSVQWDYLKPEHKSNNIIEHILTHAGPSEVRRHYLGVAVWQVATLGATKSYNVIENILTHARPGEKVRMQRHYLGVAVWQVEQHHQVRQSRN